MSHAFINSKGEYILEVAEDVYFDATPVAELECERIIKLLEDEYEQGGYEMGIVPHFIALIKGENKDYPLPLPPKTADNTETAPLSRPMKFKGEK